VKVYIRSLHVLYGPSLCFDLTAFITHATMRSGNFIYFGVKGSKIKVRSPVNIDGVWVFALLRLLAACS